MAAKWFGGLHLAGKSAVVLGCGALVAAGSYAAWTKIGRAYFEDKDEGFVDVSKVRKLSPHLMF